MEWWKSNKHRFNTWEEVREGVREYYSDHYKPDRAFNKISDFRKTVTVQKYLNDIDTPNVYTKITDHHLINIILKHISPRLHLAMAYDKDLCLYPSK